MRRMWMTAATALSLTLAACGDNDVGVQQQLGPDPKLPAEQRGLVPAMKIASPKPWGEAAPTVPQGLRAQVFAADMKNVRELFVLPNGDVLAVEPKGPSEPVVRPKDILVNLLQGYGHSDVSGGNQITLLRDADRDGRPEVRTVFLDNLNSPFGIALVGSDLYVANTDAIVRYPYQTGQTQMNRPGVLLTELPGGPINHHWTKSLVASPDGSKLYVSIGSNSNITEKGMEAEKDRAMIWEVDRATGAHRPFATGLRNPNGLTFHPETGQLWTVVNERDELGANLVPDYLTSVKPGGFYGWPYSYWGQNVDPRVMPKRPEMVARAIKPDYSLSSHVAPLDMTFDNGAQLPGFAGGAFISEHGSWNRDKFNGYKVVWVPFANGRPAGPPRDVVSGFIDGDEARGRPVGVAIDATGALLIADDLANVIWRVTRG